jgi:hypothetical protein
VHVPDEVPPPTTSACVDVPPSSMKVTIPENVKVRLVVNEVPALSMVDVPLV